MIKTIDITVSRTVSAPPEEIYAVWMDPKSPGGPWFGCERVILNPVVDGLFHHTTKHEGRLWGHYGRFLKLDRPKAIEHTWMSEATQGLETVVSITLQPKGDQTEIKVTHTGIPDDKLGRSHQEGWAWMLSMIEERFAKGASSRR